MERCGAKTRNGTPCKNWAIKGRSRCRLHGGKSLRGSDHPRYKVGLYTKYAGKSLQKVLDELAGKTGDDLINPEGEIRLMEALILASKALKNNVSDLDDLDVLSKTVDRLVSAKQRSQKILLEQKRLIPATDIEQFLVWMESVLIKKIGEDQAFNVIDQLKNFKLSDHAIN